MCKLFYLVLAIILTGPSSLVAQDRQLPKNATLVFNNGTRIINLSPAKSSGHKNAIKKNTVVAKPVIRFSEKEPFNAIFSFNSVRPSQELFLFRRSTARNTPPVNTPSACSLDTFILTTQAQINNFSTAYPGCTAPKNIFIDGTGASPAITSLSGLNGITQVVNKLKITHTSITGLSQMTALTLMDTLQLEHNSLLTSIGLNNLTQLGSIQFTDLPALTSIAGLSTHITATGKIFMDTTALTGLSGLSGLTQINGDLEIRHTPLTSLSAINNITTVEYINLQDDPALSSLGLTNLTHLYGIVLWNDTSFNNLGPLTYHLVNKDLVSVYFYGTKLSSLSGMDSAHSFINTFIGGNNLLTTLHGLEKINAINYGVSIFYNPILTSLSALNVLSSINNSKLEISGNAALTNLNGLGNLSNIGGGLWLRDNQAMTSLTGLNNSLVIQSNSGNPLDDSVLISYNYQLALCSFSPICNFLLTKPGSAVIVNNSAGCSTQAQILAGCSCSGLTHQTWNGNTSNAWNDSTNWTPVGIPTPCTRVTIPDISILPFSPHASNNIFLDGLIMAPGAELDLGNHNLDVKDSLAMDNCSIFNGTNITAHDIFNPFLQNATINGNFTCLNFFGAGQFIANQVFGNTILSDSTIRSNNCSTFFNSFHGNLSFINNSNFGNNYLSNASPNADQIDGNLNVINNSTSNISVGLGGGVPIILNGNLVINSTQGGIDINNFGFGSNGNQHLSRVGAVPLLFNNIFLQKTGGNVILDTVVTVNNSIHFSSIGGTIVSDSAKLLVLKNGCTSYNSSSNSFVIGPVKKIGNQAFTFPIGIIENNTIWYAPLQITTPASATDAFTARYYHHNPAVDGYDTSHYTTGFGGIWGKEYWKLNRDSGNSKVKITLPYDSGRSGVNYNYQYMQVAGWNGSLWRSWGTGGYTGNIYSGTLISGDSLSQFGPIAFSFKPARKPVITMGSIDSTACEGNNFNVPFTLDTLMTAGNLFRVEVSDSNGHFSTVFNYTIGSKATISSDTIIAFMPYYLFPGRHYKIRIVGSLLPDTSINTKNTVPGIIPQVTPVINGLLSVCIGNGLQKYYPSVHESGVSYTWTLNGGGTFTTNGDTAIINWTTPGTYLLTCMTSNYCGNGPQSSASILVRPPVPSATPVINNTGRWLYASQLPTNANYQWYRNGTIIAGASNSSYYASLSGTYTSRFGNSCGSGPVSNNIIFAANSLPQTINFPAIANKTYSDPPFVPNATASSGLPVALSIISGPANINTMTNLLTINGTGLVTVRANQQGDNYFDTAAPVTQSFTVSKASQTIIFDSIPDNIYGTGPVTLHAISNSGLTISFAIVSGPGTVSSNILTLTGIGTVVVRATQNGDTNYLPAAPVNRSFCSKITALNPISGYTNLCPGTATYSVNSVPGATYFWRIAGGSNFSSTTNTLNITWATPGTYSLLVSASGNCGVGSNNDTLVVHVINSIQPDSVQSMLPPNGAINQLLPLTLSWIPANPNSFYTFDLYLWRADLPQPGTPYATNLTAVNYIIPVNSGLLYNQAYKWMIVSHNGSCTLINTGPIQQFTLSPLPDLVMQNVQAPATVFSGQTISINWTVRNAGPGNTSTNQNWTDAVFLSFDTIPNFALPPFTNPVQWFSSNFPGRPLLVGTKPNVTALNNGQQYSNSINFTLPYNYNRPLYVYAITNYPAGISAPQQVSFTNDTAKAPQAIIVTLSPTPDLRVDTVFTTNTSFSGSVINVTYKVKNYGVLTPTGATWRDKVYISQSPLFNINTAIPVKLPKSNGTYYADAINASDFNNTQLLADSSYTRNLQVVVPNFIVGTYFVFVYTNANDSLYEGAFNGNNTNSSQVQVFLTPTPHLTVSSLTLPVTTVSTTQPIGANWNTNNTGFNDNIEKNKGHYFVQRGNCTIPIVNLPGISIIDSLGSGSSYWLDRVYLSTDSTGLIISNAILVNETTQGVQNSGLSSPDILLNYPCQPVGTNPGQFNINTFNVIKAGSNHPKTGNFNVPDNLVPGNYFVYVLANAAKTVFEYPGLPEVRRSALPMVVQRPDATVPSVTAPPIANGGQAITINYSVFNNGPGTVFNHIRRDKLYVSSSAIFDGSAMVIDSSSYTENLPVATSVPHSFSYTFPVSTSGTRYFYVYTNYDSAFRETNSNNNISAGAATVVSPAAANDLVVSSILVADSSFSVFPIHFKYTVSNNGGGTTAGNTWIDSVFVSCSPVFNPATSYYVAKRTHNETITTGNSYTDSFNLIMAYPFLINSCFPAAFYDTTYFYVKTNADNAVYEGNNGNNNVGSSGNRLIKNPLVDHTVISVNGPDTATVARPYLTNWTVKNIGYNPGNPYYVGWYDAIYFSPDSIFNSNAIVATYFEETTTLNQNLSYTENKNAIPPNIPTGDYYVFANTNSYPHVPITGELVLNNNTNLIRNGSGAAKKIHVIQPLLPDLRDTILSAPSTVATGQPITLVHRVTNYGAGVTYPANWSGDVFLSTDFIPGNSGDILLSGKNHVGALQPNQYFNDTITATIGLNVAPGNYVLISRTNSTGNVVESNPNNNLAFKYITVYSPAPADLIVENIIKQDTVILGNTIDTAKWVIKNISVNAASGVSSDGIYLSQSNVLDSTAVLLGVKNKIINMGPLSRDTISLSPMVNNVTEGNYNVIVKTDLLNNIVESDKTNNTGVSVTPIYVKVNELPYNVITQNTLYNISRFYKLVIPDSLNGATILVTLISGDSLTMRNQMFIGKGFVPSAAHFDFTFGTANYGNQQIVMSAVTTGVYYIAVRCVSPNPVVQNITLKAIKLPFAILNVQTGSGGNIGNVTIKISGSLYINNMTAQLTKPGTTLTASAVYFSNSTTVYATFNLQGKPLGIYNVILTKPDSSTAVMVNGFSVVNANNGGLNNGGGVNTGAGNGNAPGCDPGAAGGINSQLVMEMVTPEGVFQGWSFVIQINYNNPTNVDIPAQSRVLYSEQNIKMALTPSGVINGTTVLHLDLTEQDGPPGIIRAGGGGTVLVYTKTPPRGVPIHPIIYFTLK